MVVLPLRDTQVDFGHQIPGIEDILRDGTLFIEYSLHEWVDLLLFESLGHLPCWEAFGLLLLVVGIVGLLVADLEFRSLNGSPIVVAAAAAAAALLLIEHHLLLLFKNCSLDNCIDCGGC